MKALARKLNHQLLQLSKEIRIWSYKNEDKVSQDDLDFLTSVEVSLRDAREKTRDFEGLSIAGRRGLREGETVN